jgi:hypothetical protein
LKQGLYSAVPSFFPENSALCRLPSCLLGSVD